MKRIFKIAAFALLVVLSSSLDSLYNFGYTFPGLVQQFQNMGMKFETYQQAGLPQDQYYSRSKNFGPRAGFAYKALNGSSSFVIRGGYSLAYFSADLYEWQDNVRSNLPSTPHNLAVLSWLALSA